jgi:hypothetical protein
MCKFSYIQEDISDQASIMFIINNPEFIDGKCPYSMKLNPSSVQLNNFDKSNPYTIDGELLFYNNIVIPDTEIYLNISFPLKESKNIRIISDNPLGFSLSSIINKIKNVYKWVYKEEENTCSIKDFTIIDQCDKCDIFENLPNSMNILNSLEDFTFSSNDINKNNDKDDNHKCPICLENLENINKKTNCNHIFHKECISKWININKNTCPLCRNKLYSCPNKCNNGFIYKQYNGKIIPKNIRGILSRNTTDGVFGIYDYDFEDLFIDEMFYNRMTKILYPKIFG